MKRFCINPNCVQKPELCHTGEGEHKPQWYCFYCETSYYVDKEGRLTTERPFEWPTTIKRDIEKYEIKDGHWKSVNNFIFPRRA